MLALTYKYYRWKDEVQTDAKKEAARLAQRSEYHKSLIHQMEEKNVITQK